LTMPVRSIHRCNAMACPLCRPRVGDSVGGELNLRLSSEKVLPCRPGRPDKRERNRHPPSSKSVPYSASWCLVLSVSVWIHSISASKEDKRAGLWGSRYRLDSVERCSRGRRGAATGQTPAPARNCGSAASVMVEGYMLGRIGGIGEAGRRPLGDRLVFIVRPSYPRPDGEGTLPSLCR
jgi:hypothetical protein